MLPGWAAATELRFLFPEWNINKLRARQSLWPEKLAMLHLQICQWIFKVRRHQLTASLGTWKRICGMIQEEFGTHSDNCTIALQCSQQHPDIYTLFFLSHCYLFSTYGISCQDTNRIHSVHWMETFCYKNYLATCEIGSFCFWHLSQIT